jgi:ergothioneine biosynthesis protein EgtB
VGLASGPTRWHLAHTTWFFETFLLAKWERDYRPVDSDYQYFFNSYYNTVGKQFPRPRRGMLTRPTVADVFDYRRIVEQRVLQLLEECGEQADAEIGTIVELGIQHEQQHQELMLTDLKHLFSWNPLWPAYRPWTEVSSRASPAVTWSEFPGGVVEIGQDRPEFAFDNERPRHRVYLEPYALQDRLVTCGEYLEFLHDGGYRRPELWLSMGWGTVQEQQWQAPMYWVERDGAWHQFTLGGLQPIEPATPVCHVSYFEADAFARWSGARLPTEAEWEHAVGDREPACQPPNLGHCHHAPCDERQPGLAQLYGEVWQWTASPYTPYPGFVAPAGALGEYNGKFMCNQYVLRGSSCATPAGHARSTYRNFFPPDARWQFTGIRLARDTAAGSRRERV